VLSVLLLLGLLPGLLLIGILILIDSGRPVFFVQERVGQKGTRFPLYKFRTLTHGPHDPTRPADYATRVGAVLRRWALDELPQLWNVLRGNMSLVGPRPVPSDHLDAYGPRERTRLAVRPGLTGWAQIHGRNALSWDERIEHDVWYVNHRSLRLDLYIVARTPVVLLNGTGVYGPEGQNPSYAESLSSSS
jgi:lipopolysaccharide/colanic/teichoic acid biosynthesis glycosyltransferase